MIHYIIVNALMFIVIPLGIFFLFGFLIFYHLNRYGLRGDESKKSALFFSFVLILISIAIIIIFLFVDWKKISLSDFMERSNIELFRRDVYYY